MTKMTNNKMTLTPARIDRGVQKLLRDVVRKADANQSKMLSGQEVLAWKGPGKAVLQNMFCRVARVDTEKAIRMSLVDIRTLEKDAKKLATELKTIDRDRGDRNGKLDGTPRELGHASDAAASLARWIQAHAR